MTVGCCVMARRSFISTQPQTAGGVIAGSVGLGGSNVKSDVQLIQALLNLVAPLSLGTKPLLKTDGIVGPLTIAAIKQFQKTSLGFADGRIDPNGKTLDRLNVLTVKRGKSPVTASSASSLVTAPTAPPGPTPKMTPMDAALEATPRAISWCQAAILHVAALNQGLVASGGVILFPFAFSTINTHFHLDQEPTSIMVNLQKMQSIFTRIITMLRDPAKFYKEGPETADSVFADAPMGGMVAGPPHDKITIRPQYPDCGPMCRSAMLVHEGAHFTGGINEIGHFSHEFPIPDGTPQDGSTHNYAQMTASESMRNAASYAAFAINVSFLQDLRFGLDKKST